MDNLSIKGALYIPMVHFDAQTGVLEMSGESYHEYTREFFQPIMEWLKEFLSQPGRQVVFNLKMTYFNTSSSRRFLEIFSMLDDYQQHRQGNVTVNWFYQQNDWDIKEMGEEFAEDVSAIRFNLVSYSAAASN